MGRKKPKAGVTSGGSGWHRVTLTRIARELGVSAMTVSNAYNHPGRLSEALRERIFETAGRLGYYGPDPVGRSLRRQRTDVVGVLYSNPLSYAFDDPAAVSFLGGLSSVTEEADLGLLLVPAAGGGESSERDPRAAAQAAVDGFVIYSMRNLCWRQLYRGDYRLWWWTSHERRECRSWASTTRERPEWRPSIYSTSGTRGSPSCRSASHRTAAKGSQTQTARSGPHSTLAE